MNTSTLQHGGQIELTPEGAWPGRSPSLGESVSPGVRVIKRYSNRKLYDTQSSKYVTLPQIADLVRAGTKLRIVDNRTGEDKTEVTFALIISEELRSSPRGIPLDTLTALIIQPGPTLVDLAPFAPSALPGDPEMTEPKYNDLRAKFEHWFAEVARESAAQPAQLGALEEELRRLNDRLTRLESQITTKGE